MFSPHGSWCQDKRSYTWGMFPHCKYKHLNQTSASKFFYMRCLLVMNFVFLSFISADWKDKSRLFVATFSRFNTPCRLFQTSVLKNQCPGSPELWLLWYRKFYSQGEVLDGFLYLQNAQQSLIFHLSLVQ